MGKISETNSEREIQEYYSKLDSILESKNVDRFVEFAKENGWSKNYSEKAYTIALHKLIVTRKIGSQENQRNSYNWLEDNGYYPDSFKQKY